MQVTENINPKLYLHISFFYHFKVFDYHSILFKHYQVFNFQALNHSKKKKKKKRMVKKHYLLE